MLLSTITNEVLLLVRKQFRQGKILMCYSVIFTMLTKSLKCSQLWTTKTKLETNRNVLTLLSYEDSWVESIYL